ncbi:hypothetical protein L6452_10257 [Arctium lappa]|uniref:Uncharacterized protein n=1 Tax=Arctium lappa TaxID=4217 RepID=A0ACB9DMV7_ARCLA|nr:hypothetical protein L6452_10257 [Arctium lappa]
MEAIWFLSHCSGDLALSLTAPSNCRWFLSHCSGDLALSLSLLTVWFLSHCSCVRWRRSGVEKGGGYLAHERWRRSGFSLTAQAIWLSLSLLRRTAAGFSLTAPAIWLSLSHCSLLTIWFLYHCSRVRWRRSGVEKGGGYLVININYFPGYEKLPCYETVMTDFFLNLMKSHTVEKTTTDDRFLPTIRLDPPLSLSSDVFCISFWLK